MRINATVIAGSTCGRRTSRWPRGTRPRLRSERGEAGDVFEDAGFCGDLSFDGLSGVGDHDAEMFQQVEVWRGQTYANETLRVVPYVPALMRCPLIEVPNGVVHYSSSERVEHSVARMTCSYGFYDVHAGVEVDETNPIPATCVRTFANAPEEVQNTRDAVYIQDV